MNKAKYTVVLKSLLDDPVAKLAIDKALSTYPLYQPSKQYELIPVRAEINKKLLNHFKYREIGFETPGRFIDELEITMCEIMPHYNSMFKTIEIMEELPSPFDNVDVIETFEQETTGQTTNTGNNHTTDTTETNTQNTTESETNATDNGTNTTNMTDNGKNVKSETPQGQINISANNIDAVPYADNVQWNKNTSNSETTNAGETTSNSTTTDNGTNTTTGVNDSTTNTESNTTATLTHTYTKKGNQGINTYAHDMNEYRTALIDVVNQIINDKRLSQLFMMIY